MVNSSFFADGEVYDTADVVSNDHTASTAPSQAPSSFYPDGQQYTQADVAATDAARDEAVAAAVAALASQGAAHTSETNAASSAAAALASQNASSTSEGNALSYKNAAATSAANAATSEGNALTYKNAAATSASNAATSEGNALSSKNAAATSASNAATSETNAHNSEVAAATSASNAAAAVQAAAGTATPLMDSTALVGSGVRWAREDHRHPSDTSKADLASPVFTGAPKAPTPSAGDNSTNLATTAWVNANVMPPYAYVVYGIDKTGATDVGAALNAIIQATPLYSTIFLPIGIYSTSVTILVNGGRTLIGVSGGIQAGTTDAGSCIKASTLTLSPIVKVDGGAGSQSCSVKNLNITRTTGTIGTSTIGLQINKVNNATYEDVFVSRSGIGIDLLDGNVTLRFERCTVFSVNAFYMAMHGTAVEITCHMCRFGINGGIDIAATCYLFMDGGGWDTIRFDHCQWNCSIASGVQHGIYFNAYNGSNPNGIFRMDMMHIEGPTNDFIVSVGQTVKIPRFSIHNSQINSPGVTFCASTAVFQEWSLVGTDINMNLIIDQWSNGRMSACLVSGTTTLNGLNGTLITGNLFYTNTTLSGSCPKAAFVGNSVNGTFTNTATSSPIVANNA